MALALVAGEAAADPEARRAPPPPEPVPGPPLSAGSPGPVRLGNPPAAAAPELSGPGRRLRFTAREDPDGSRFVWFLLDRAGVPCEYLPAAEFLASPRWEPVPRDRRLPGDVAWWKGYVALFRGARPEGEVSTGAGPRRLQEMEAERGPARFLRRLDAPPLRPAPRSLDALGRTVRFQNPDPGAWTEGEPRRHGAAVTLRLWRRPLREPSGGQAIPAIALRAAAAGTGAPAASLGIPAEARTLKADDAPAGSRRLLAWGGEAASRALVLSRDEEGLSLAAACTASETTWRVVERECRAFLDSLSVEPAR
jgi:hypothetical protein